MIGVRGSEDLSEEVTVELRFERRGGVEHGKLGRAEVS